MKMCRPRWRHSKKYVDDAILTGGPNYPNPKKLPEVIPALNIFDESLDGGVSALRVKIDGNERLLAQGRFLLRLKVYLQDNPNNIR